MATRNAIKDKTNNKVKEPRKYNAVMYNDDFTTMEFVVSILIEIFHKSELEAESLMMKVHKSGSAIVGTYPYDIAVTRISKAISRAKAEGFPFRIELEEA